MKVHNFKSSTQGTLSPAWPTQDISKPDIVAYTFNLSTLLETRSYYESQTALELTLLPRGLP